MPLVYACSGGSGAGQVANGVAVALDRLDIAEMASISAVGGCVARHLELLASGRPIIAIDGCPYDCACEVLAQKHVVPILHIRLDRRGTERHRHQSYDDSVIERELAYAADLIQRVAWGESPGAE